MGAEGVGFVEDGLDAAVFFEEGASVDLGGVGGED